MGDGFLSICYVMLKARVSLGPLEWFPWTAAVSTFFTAGTTSAPHTKGCCTVPQVKPSPAHISPTNRPLQYLLVSDDASHHAGKSLSDLDSPES